MGGNELFAAAMMPTSTWSFANESATILPGHFSFDIIYELTSTGPLALRPVQIRYTFFNVTSIPVEAEVHMHAIVSGPYVFFCAVSGSGTVTIGTQSTNLSAGNGTLYERSENLPLSRILNVEFHNLSVSYLLVIPQSLVSRFAQPDRNAFEGYNSLAGTVSLLDPGGNATLAIAIPGWVLVGSNPLGTGAMGQLLYSVVGGERPMAQVPGALALNVAQIIGTIALYAAIGAVAVFGLRYRPASRPKPFLGQRCRLCNGLRKRFR